MNVMSVFSHIKYKKVWSMVGGIAIGLVAPSVLKSQTARKAAVNVVAKSMSLKDSATATCVSIKEDAQDVYAEAKQKAVSGDAPRGEQGEADEA